MQIEESTGNEQTGTLLCRGENLAGVFTAGDLNDTFPGRPHFQHRELSGAA